MVCEYGYSIQPSATRMLPASIGSLKYKVKTCSPASRPMKRASIFPGSAGRQIVGDEAQRVDVRRLFHGLGDLHDVAAVPRLEQPGRKKEVLPRPRRGVFARSDEVAEATDAEKIAHE